MSWSKILQGYFYFSIVTFVALMTVVELQQEEIPVSPVPPPVVELVPDFNDITPLSEKKRAFFDYLQPIIESENQNITELRARLLELQMQSDITADEFAFIQQLRIQYQIKPNSDWQKTITKLLKKVNNIPSSLVLAQAAIESAWGTSRFAQQGYNLFGQWCFKQGCGMVPQERQDGLNHEVRVFQSIQDSVHHYMINLNSHPAYKKLRALRDEQLAQSSNPSEDVSGCLLAEGLENYSQKGLRYVNAIKQLIRVNKLEPKSIYCKKIVIAEVPDFEELPATGAVNDVKAFNSSETKSKKEKQFKKIPKIKPTSADKEQQALADPVSPHEIPSSNGES